MRQNQPKLKSLNLQVKVISFDGESMAMEYAQSTQLEWPLLLDTERQLYQAYGMERASWWALYNPVSIWKYLKLICAGKGPGKPGRDWRQLGGDVLIDPRGIVRLHFVSINSHDRPSVEAILAAATQ